MNPSVLADIRRKYNIYHPQAPHAWTLDTTRLSAEEAAERVVEHLREAGLIDGEGSA